jgi:multidrug efflux pump subunit AcrB
MAQNSVAANLLMFVILVMGLLGASRIKQEIFPEFTLDYVTVSVPYPGASPTEVEQGIVLAVEEEVRGLDGVKRVQSAANEGAGVVSVELLLGADHDRVLNDVKAAVDRIVTFPEDAERPTVSLASRKREVISLIFAGDQDRRALHDVAEQARRRLLESPDVTQAELAGVPPLEISIEVDRARTEGLGLSLDDIARQVTLASLELPGGEVETSGGEFLVRVSDRKLAGAEFADVIVASTADGAQVRLGDVATIKDAYQDTDLEYFFNGEPAVRLTVYRVGNETPSAVAAAVKQVAAELQSELPSTVTLTTWKDDSKMLDERIDLLLRNGRSGLILVVLVLALFLDLRLAFWVALGIPLSFAGAFILAPVAGVSINMVSLFALIVVLGLVVDDAIVVGENIYELTEKGLSRREAAIEGARQMAMPVTFAVLTSVAAFSPLLFVPGVMGKIFGIIPIVVISVLLFSLIEGFFILPAHLGHGDSSDDPRPGSLIYRLEAPRRWMSRVLAVFIERQYRPMLAWVIEWRHTTMAIATATLILTVGVLKAQIVPFSFFPKLEGNNVMVSARLPYGAPTEATNAVRLQLEEALTQTVQEFEQSSDNSVMRGVLMKVGEANATGGPAGGAGATGSHLLGVEVELVGTEERDFTSQEFALAWQAKVPPLAGVDALSFESSSGPGAGKAVDVQLSHPDTEVLAQRSAELAETLRTYTDLRDVENSYAAGKPQLDFTLLPNARTLGLSATDVARQLRASFYGSEALREQRGRNELRVMVRLPEDERGSEFDVEQLRIKTPQGRFVPLGSVATFSRNRAPTAIAREAGQRTVNVSAELSASARSSQDVVQDLKSRVIPALQASDSELRVELVGEQREQNESLSSLAGNFGIALFVIYALLAIPFRSYTQPLIIMSAIPFGIVGAVMGHLVMGFELSIISMMGIIALSGVVVNDSLVLIDAANGYRKEGQSAVEAIINAGARRMRPILLTSLTTFFGLVPMIFETSPQARFLIPMAISLGFGVLFATVIVLVLVPALYMIVEEFFGLIKRIGGWFLGRLQPATPVEPELDAVAR